MAIVRCARRAPTGQDGMCKGRSRSFPGNASTSQPMACPRRTPEQPPGGSVLPVADTAAISRWPRRCVIAAGGRAWPAGPFPPHPCPGWRRSSTSWSRAIATACLERHPRAGSLHRTRKADGLCSFPGYDVDHVPVLGAAGGGGAILFDLREVDHLPRTEHVLDVFLRRERELA